MEYKPRTINSTSFLNIVLEIGLDALKQNRQDNNFVINYIYKNENNTELEVKQDLESLEEKEQKEKYIKKKNKKKPYQIIYYIYKTLSITSGKLKKVVNLIMHGKCR